MIYKILDLFFPPICEMCGKLGEGYICKSCYENIKSYLYKDNHGNNFYLLNYKDIVRDKIIDYKFNDKSYLCYMFSEIIIKNKKACDFIKSYDIIIPVPMHKKKKARRGYNQSELIAKIIGKKLKIPNSNSVLEKQINTPMQSMLGKNDRKKYIKNAYKVNNIEKIRNKKVLLADDVYTTGATINECRNVLKLAGAKNIGAIIIAKD